MVVARRVLSGQCPSMMSLEHSPSNLPNPISYRGHLAGPGECHPSGAFPLSCIQEQVIEPRLERPPMATLAGGDHSHLHGHKRAGGEGVEGEVLSSAGDLFSSVKPASCPHLQR